VTRDPSWHAGADLLAERMFHRANCADHSAAEADRGNCPFCADRSAYEAWERKSGRTHRDAYDGPVLDVLADYRVRRGHCSAPKFSCILGFAKPSSLPSPAGR
jgi:hypothetical protein